MAIGYKVVKVIDDIILSYLQQNKIRYKVGEWVSPEIPNSKLFFFDTLENAIEFKRANGETWHEIYSCEVDEVSDIQPTSIFSSFEEFWESIDFAILSGDSIEDVYRSYGKEKLTGCLSTNRIKLLERVLL